MNESLINTIWLAMAFAGLFVSAEVLYHFLKVKASVTRKYVHVLTGFLTMLFPPLIGNHWLVLALCVTFLLVLVASFPLKLLPSINAVDRVTRGSVIYPIVVYCCYLAYQYFDNYLFYYIPILTLAICDPIAELIGKNFTWIPYRTFGHTKTISGSLGFFGSSFLLSLSLLLLMNDGNIPTIFMLSLLIALLTSIAEGLSHKGYDNLSIPGITVLVLSIADYLNYI